MDVAHWLQLMDQRSPRFTRGPPNACVVHVPDSVTRSSSLPCVSRHRALCTSSWQPPTLSRCCTECSLSPSETRAVREASRHVRCKRAGMAACSPGGLHRRSRFLLVFSSLDDACLFTVSRYPTVGVARGVLVRPPAGHQAAA